MTNLPVVAAVEKAHAAHGASAAERWMNCPGSVRLTQGLPDTTTIYAEEGTAAHELMELALKSGRDPETWLGEKLNDIEVTDEMVEAVRAYREVVHGILLTESGQMWVEKVFSLEALAPPVPMFGTADTIIFNPGERKLYVIDLKYGQGVAVEVENNPQLQYYGVGAVIEVEKEIGAGRIDEVVLVIVQPRAGHKDGPVRSWSVDYMDLMSFAGELLTRADATQEPNAPLNPGRWCRFCKASAVCPARYEQSVALARVDFANMEKVGPPAPTTLTVSQLVHILDRIDILEDWARSVRQHAQGLLERGEDVPGYKLVAKRATRKWNSEREAVEYLKATGLTDDEIFDRKLKSPAQAEKLLPKQEREAMNAQLVSKVSSGYSLAPTSDSRPEVTVTPGFVALPSGDE